MARWKIKIKGLRSLLEADNTDNEAKRISKEIYKLITNNPQYNKAFEDFDRLDDFNNGFVETVEEIDDLLNEMYNYCDDNLIWIAFK